MSELAEIFDPAEMRVFEFKDRTGAKRAVDPVEVYDQFLAETGYKNIKDLFETYYTMFPKPDYPPGLPYDVRGPIMEAALEAKAILYHAILKAFDLKSLKEDAAHGFSAYQAFDLYFELCKFMNSLKKNTVETPNLPPLSG